MKVVSLGRSLNRWCWILKLLTEKWRCLLECRSKQVHAIQTTAKFIYWCRPSGSWKLAKFKYKIEIQECLSPRSVIYEHRWWISRCLEKINGRQCNFIFNKHLDMKGPSAISSFCFFYYTLLIHILHSTDALQT